MGICTSNALEVIITSHRVLPGMGDYEMGHVCVCKCVCECVHPLMYHTVCSKAISVTDFFSKKSPNQFLCPPIFFRFCGLGLKLKRVMATLKEKMVFWPPGSHFI